MYIPEFWAGVLCTVLTELIITICMIIIATNRKDQ